MFFHEVMSTSARLVVAQHGYESVLEGMSRNHSHFSRVMARHGIEISPAVLDAKPWSIPVRSLEAGDLPERLRKTVFGGRRARANQQRVEKLARAIDLVEAEVAATGKPIVPEEERPLPPAPPARRPAKRPGAAARAPRPRRRTAGTPASRPSSSRPRSPS
jgi:N-dimethylarginine dimethylaminohydrolase